MDRLGIPWTADGVAPGGRGTGEGMPLERESERSEASIKFGVGGGKICEQSGRVGEAGSDAEQALAGQGRRFAAIVELQLDEDRVVGAGRAGGFEATAVHDAWIETGGVGAYPGNADCECAGRRFNFEPLEATGDELLELILQRSRAVVVEQDETFTNRQGGPAAENYLMFSRAGNETGVEGGGERWQAHDSSGAAAVIASRSSQPSVRMWQRRPPRPRSQSSAPGPMA